ncbi:hypothetical protein COY13_04890 [Candidatus Roizmanbacteria bacterium CG_4_10_14_0_2_um_filter_36_35]|uniref:Enolase n=4 Tax=Candidatus Roizmaniibacteriota TaxID=1752723 RepID=A0A2M7BXA2_9BACT|nr:MAG: hypothetical protein COV86_03595 [Candidatus Roizmanbacteria bacterium CG11_big_fil_rev_8_21_14_0_20_35_14]PIV11203.1 MAG: hypothetical protein COS50_01425 [Candidatus Roizmanbacteria bacterium CG03_land_8_20_14_0_80_35_26]PIZ66750.1 MAG: hypothetical protein COY13_04890 [Candidatus Roizmanbacteria bacterium CG_4_10_14_0_2_um_filter_36_35]PJC33222.1 MAG: hypothetical protein CO049_00940 [Candidatus Roizmanbacteria bacterium CG_4_9_14_0_2_um_filter_36_12]PJC80669.1 MAG: hypothetical prot
MSTIKKITASEIINSRGYPAIFGKLILDDGQEVITSIPSFETVGDYQSRELRDNDKNRYNGRGVTQAVSYINELLGPKLQGVSPVKQLEIDNWLIKADGTKDKNRLGVNTLLTISYLVARAGAYEQKLPLFKYINSFFEKFFPPSVSLEKLPSPIFTLLIGGKHGQIDLDFKEFQIIPSSSFFYSQSYQAGVDLYHLLRELYKFNFSFNLDVIEAIKETVTKKGLAFSRDIFLGINFGASSYQTGSRYLIKDKQQSVSAEEYLNFIDKSIIKRYSPLIITDPLANEDWQNWQKLNSSISKEIYLTTDELIGSNKERLEKVIKEKICSSVTIRPSQIGTITETFGLIDIARKNKLSYQISSDFGETDDSFIADFSVGVGADFVNFGPPVHGENVAKYNRLLEIEREIKNHK